MKLVGVMMVRNEADIIEAAVRHNLGCLDRLTVLDHGSFDGTSDILGKLAAETDALRIINDPSVAYQQSRLTTHLTRDAIVRDGADFVFPIDADEFLKVPSREKLETALQQLPGALHVLMDWQTYVPDNLGHETTAFTPSRLTWRRKSELYPIRKVAVARHLAERPREAVATGNHLVWDMDRPDALPPHALITPQIAAVAHVPVRSVEQLERKIVIGYLAHLVANPDRPNMAFHWRDAYEEIRAGRAYDPIRLREIAVNYGLKRQDWQPDDAIEMVEDPFPSPVELKYQADASLSTLQLLMRFCERLIYADAERAKKAGAETQTASSRPQ
jgi:hypothetical protein